jgi:hypothetical protein
MEYEVGRRTLKTAPLNGRSSMSIIVRIEHIENNNNYYY